MGKTLDKHRIANRYKRDLDALYGDDTGSDATLYTNLFAEAAKGVGSFVSEKQKKDALNAANQEMLNAKAAVAKADADEKDKNGPLHKAANDRLSKAQTKLSQLVPSSTPSTPSASGGGGGGGGGRHESSGMPWWGWGLIGLGGLGASLVVLKSFRGGKR